MSNKPVFQFFSYALDFSSVTVGAPQTKSFTIQADASFVLQKLAYIADISGAAVTDSTRVIPLVTALITDNSSGRQLSDAGVPVSSIFGRGDLPFILPRALALDARTTVSVQLTNVSAATVYNIRLAFIGEKRFA